MIIIKNYDVWTGEQPCDENYKEEKPLLQSPATLASLTCDNDNNQAA